jgi:hypothetical protein
MDSFKERIKALQAKAARMQEAEDACPGHLWVGDYISKLGPGGSCRCKICGTRRSWDDAEKEGTWAYSEI